MDCNGIFLKKILNFKFSKEAVYFHALYYDIRSMPLIFDMRWNDQNKLPFFQIIENKIKNDFFLQINQPFFLSISSEPLQCVGHIKNGEYISCPNNAQGTKKCEICKKAEEYFPCQFCNGFNCVRFSPEKIENCDAEHMVYLALFSEDIIKVGVSRMSREKARQFEQGSHMTRIFARGISGVQARRIETNLTKAGFPDKIPASQKRNILFPDITAEKAEILLDERYEYAKEYIISMMPEMKKYLVENEVWDMRSFYAGSEEHFEKLEQNQKPVHFLELTNGDSIGGILRMVKGSYAVVETPTELAIILCKTLIGITISFDPCNDGISLAAGGFQGALF